MSDISDFSVFPVSGCWFLLSAVMEYGCMLHLGHTHKNTHSIPTIHILLSKLIAAFTVVWPVNPVVVSISTHLHLHLYVSCVSLLCTIQYLNTINIEVLLSGSLGIAVLDSGHIYAECQNLSRLLWTQLPFSHSANGGWGLINVSQ